MSLKKYIKNKKPSHFSVATIEVIIKDPLPASINMRSCVSQLVKKVPKHLRTNVEIIYVGQFEDLKKRSLQAQYRDGGIFITNEMESNEDVIDDLIHETAHSVEESYTNLIYSDGLIEKEFLNKREQLFSSLKGEGFNVELQNFLNVEYERVFDEFLYSEVGYPMLSLWTVNLFFSPYAATSLREYFANGFEAFFLREDLPRLKSVSPQLYRKIIDLTNIEKTL